MKTNSNDRSLFAGLLKFLNEVASALFISVDKKEFQRLKNFIGS